MHRDYIIPSRKKKTQENRFEKICFFFIKTEDPYFSHAA